MALAFIGLGSNLGEPVRNLSEAAKRLGALEGVRVARASRIYRTEPQELRDQPWFANMVVAVDLKEDAWTPEGLLDEVKRIEVEAGRRQGVRFGPRMLDIDILAWERERIETERLRIPHPRMRQRAFVLVPLREIAPDFVFPDGELLTKVLQTLDFDMRDGMIRQA